MRRALLLGDADPSGGTGTYFRRIRGFLGADFRLHIAMRPGQDRILEQEPTRANITHSTHPIIFGKIERYANKVFNRLGIGLVYSYYRDLVTLFWLEKKYRPHVVFISQGGGVRYFPALMLDVPVIIACHSLFTSPLNDQFWGLSYFKRLSKADAAGSNKRLLFMSAYAETLFRKNIGPRSLACASAVVPNFGEELGVEFVADKKIRVLTIGHVVEYKNPRVWLEVARRLNTIYPGKLSWTWAGAGSELAAYRKKTAAESDIDFIGYRKGTRELYSQCDIYFQPSVWESQGISVVEAMAASLPCVVSSAGGLPESVQNGSEGFVCGPNAIEEYVKAFQELIEDPKLRGLLGRNARKKYDSVFSRGIWMKSMEKQIALSLERNTP